MVYATIDGAFATLKELGAVEDGPARGDLARSSRAKAAVLLVQRLAEPSSDIAHRLAGLDLGQHRALACGLVLAEEACGVSFGSVDVVIWVYESFSSKFPDDADDLADWILRHSTNYWAPFGRMRGHARSLGEYHQHLEWLSLKKAHTAEQEQNRAAIKAAKEATRKRVAGYRNRVQSAAVEARRQLIGEISNLDPAACLEHLAWDDSRPLSFYPASLADAAEGAWLSVANETRQTLLAKAAKIPRGGWRRWWQHHKTSSSTPSRRPPPGGN